MNCLEVRDSLSAWLDGELAPEVLALVDRHLESCAGCRRELAQLQALDRALETLETPEPAGLPEGLQVRLRRPPRRRWQSMALAASLILGITLGGAMARDFYPVTQQENGFNSEVASLEAFHDFPRGSLGMVLASYQEDEGSDNLK